MKSAILKRIIFGIEMFTVIVKDGDKQAISVFPSEEGAHNWLRNKLREASNDRS